VVPAIGSYRFTCALDYNNTTVQYVFELKWNPRMSAWFMNVLEADDTPIISNQAVVLGAFIGRWSQHPLFQYGGLYAYDVSGAEIDAGYNDFGTRVVVLYAPQEDLALVAGAQT
jgi:hypothetical protein